MSWVIQTRMTSGWETVGETDGVPDVYSSREEAEAELNDHISSCLEAVRAGHMSDLDPADWRVHNTEEDQ